MVDWICIAAADSTAAAKERADYICRGENDENVFRQAVEACIEQEKNLYLFNGRYHIDRFMDFGDEGPLAAICVPNAHREFRFEGQNHEYGFQKRFDNGVVLYISEKALAAADGKEASVLRGRWTPFGIQNGSCLRLENVAVVLANNRHAVRCVDLRRVDRVEVKNLSLISYGDAIAPDSPVGLSTAPPIPAKGCIGLTMTDGSNYNYSNYTNVQTWGFDEGIQVGGEHVVCINCGATIGNYGFTFGNYPLHCGANHPITLINCMDERNVNLPYFGRWCGDNARDGGRLVGGQEVALISFNLERVAAQTPGGRLGDFMKEEIPGSWRGRIEFTIQPDWCATNAENFQLWENDGSGSGIITRNSTHKAVCSTQERENYYPTLGQQLFDTDLNRMLICIDPQKRLWVDFMGNPV